MRILPTIEDNLRLGRSTKLLSLSLACWFEFICQGLKSGNEIIDPIASQLNHMPQLLSTNVLEVVEAFLTIESVFNQTFKDNAQLKDQLADSLTALRIGDIKNISNIVDKLSA